MNDGDIRISTALATGLLDRQMPDLAALPVRPMSRVGTDNALFRLGNNLVMRFPRRASAIALLQKELTWLPHLTDLPLRVPEPLRLGAADSGYPAPWAVYRWIPGDPVAENVIDDAAQMARDLAQFICALRDLPGTGGPIAGSANSHRGVALADIDETARAAIDALGRQYSRDHMHALWQTARDAPVWDGPPLWVHGDLKSDNLLALNGRLSAVIDFGQLARGDPAVDLTPAWQNFDLPARDVYLAASGLDHDTQLRGLGWALYTGVIGLAYYGDTMPALAKICRRTISAALSDFGV